MVKKRVIAKDFEKLRNDINWLLADTNHNLTQHKNMAHLAKGKDIFRVDLPFNDLGSEHVELLLLEELYGSNT